MRQRDYMRKIYKQLGDNEQSIVDAYASAERNGEVERKRDAHDLSPEAYAQALYQDGIRKKWIYQT